MLQNSEKNESLKKYIKTKFEIGEEMKDFELILGNKKIRITSKDFLSEVERLGGVSGVCVFRKGKVWNPTSNIVFVLGHLSRKKYELNKGELIKLFKIGELNKEIPEEGYVILSFRNFPISLAFNKNGILKCMMPKEFRREILEILKEQGL